MTDLHHPLVTFALLVYNQERFVREAVEAAFAQTYSPLEIIVSDDCSTDGTFPVVQEMVARYRGPHRVILNRNEKNLGLVGHLNLLMSRASGELVVVGGGDDVSLPHRVERLVGAYSASDGQPLSIYSNMIVIDEDGGHRGIFTTSHSLEVSPQDIAEFGSGVFGCTQAWARRIFEVFGPLDEEVIHEDVVIPFRAGLLGRVCYLDEPLVLYRRHSSNLFRMRREISTWRALHEYLLKHASGRIAMYRSMLTDIAIARKNKLCPLEVLETARSRAAVNLGDAQVEAHLLRGMRVGEFIRAVYSRAKAGSRYTRLLKWLLMAFAPRLYFLVWRYKL